MRYIYIILFCWGTTAMMGQSDDKIHIIECVHNGSVKLRWVAPDYDTWSAGNTYGYKITRLTTYSQGASVSGAAMDATATTIAASIKPLSDSLWNTTYPDYDLGMAAKSLLYTPDSELSGDDLQAGLMKKESEDARYVYSLIISEQDYNIAKSMAMGLEDFSISNDEKYTYIIQVDHPDYDKATGRVHIDATQLTNFDAIQNIRTNSIVDEIQLYWDSKATAEQYTAYDIERSSDGVTFALVNQKPYFYSGPDDESTVIFYADSVPDYNVYYYRILGRNSFGGSGPVSDIVQGRAKPPKQPISYKIDTFEVTGPDRGTLRWNSLGSGWSQSLTGFNVYESDQVDGGFILSTSNTISSEVRSYSVTGITSYKYYYVEATDAYGYKYRTGSILAQVPDETPPQVPSNVYGSFVTPSTVVIEWDDVPDLDLEGYRVFVANDRTSDMIQVTTQPLAQSKYVHEVNPYVMIDSIYFRILATDNRENNSERSQMIAIERPDVIPPAQPILYKSTPTPDGIELGWRFSNSDDVIRHVLQRKPKGTTNWVDLLTIAVDDHDQYHSDLTPDDITSTCYIDEEILERRVYEYRLIAYDDNNNASTSKLFEVRPYDNGMRGSIDDFSVGALCEPLDSNNLPNQAAFDTLRAALHAYESGELITNSSLQQLVFFGVIQSEEYNELIKMEQEEIYDFLIKRKVDYWQEYIVVEVQLRWTYQAHYDYLKDYQIYRSTAGSPMILYKTVSADDIPIPRFIDSDVRSGRRYLYQIMARHLDEGFSERSEVRTIKVPTL